MTAPVVYVVAAAAPPVLELGDLLDRLMASGWTPCVILTPTAASWVDVDALAELTGHAVRVHPRLPHEQDPLPTATAVIAAPLTFNTINKWAHGTSDTLALGLLNELLGQDVPIVAAPVVKAALRSHPAYAPSIAALAAAGVRLLDPDVVTVRREDGTVTVDWGLIVQQLGAASPE